MIKLLQFLGRHCNAIIFSILLVGLPVIMLLPANVILLGIIWLWISLNELKKK